MWYTVPQDKEEQKQAFALFNESFEADTYTDEVRQNMETLLEVYNGERPFDAASDYDKLFTVYYEMGLTNAMDREALFGEKNSLKDFKKDFLEAWRSISYNALAFTSGIEFTKSVRDECLEAFDALHASKKMPDQEITNFARNMNLVLDSGEKQYVRDGIKEIENTLGNRQNADEIVLGVRDSEDSRYRYVKNRLQLLRQFADGDVQELRAYMPFYDTLDKIRAGKAAPEDAVKKASEAMHDAGLQDIRKRVTEAFAQNAPDPVHEKIRSIDNDNDKAIQNALNTAKVRFKEAVAKEERRKDGFFQYATQSYDRELKYLPGRVKQMSEYETMLQENQKILQDIKAKLQSDPDIANYEEQLNDKVAEFEQALNDEIANNKVPKLDVEAQNSYVQAWTEYKNVINQGYIRLKQEEKKLSAEYNQYGARERELDQKQEALVRQSKNLDVMTKEQMEQLLQDKAKLDLERKAMRENTLVVCENRKKSIDALLAPLAQKVEQAEDALAPRIKKRDVEFTPEQLETIGNNYQTGKDSLKALNEKYATYFQDVTKRYDHVVEGMKRSGESRQKLQEVYEAAGDITRKKGFFGRDKKNPKIFNDTMRAVGEYLQDSKDLNKAKNAYDACRTYVANYMKADQSGLKSGSTAGNTRRQTVVRMLELMEEIPEFNSLTERVQDDWVVVESNTQNNKKNVTEKYTKLDYKKLEQSLAKHATKQKHQEKNAFADIDKLINKKKEKGM